MKQNNIVANLSPSSILSLLTDQVNWHDKYVLKNWESKTWFGTIAGSVFHDTVDSWIKSGRTCDIYSVSKEFILDAVHAYKTGKTVLKDKEQYTEDSFKEELEVQQNRLIAVFLEYQETINWEKVVSSEVKFRSRIGTLLGKSPEMVVTGKVDLDTNDEVYDWKTVKTYDDKEIDYTIQGVIYGLLKAEHTGVMPKQTRFVEFLRTESYEDKLAKWKGDVRLWEDNGSPKGERPRKPSKPKVEKPLYREVIIPMDQWRIDVVLEIVQRIQDALSGVNLFMEGRPLPPVSSKYGIPDGWVKFVENVTGMNPWTGEITDMTSIADLDISFLD